MLKSSLFLNLFYKKKNHLNIQISSILIKINWWFLMCWWNLLFYHFWLFLIFFHFLLFLFTFYYFHLNLFHLAFQLLWQLINISLLEIQHIRKLLDFNVPRINFKLKISNRCIRFSLKNTFESAVFFTKHWNSLLELL